MSKSVVKRAIVTSDKHFPLADNATFFGANF